MEPSAAEVPHDASGSQPATTGECFGEEAIAFIESLLLVGTPLRLERDVVGRDDYAQSLAVDGSLGRADTLKFVDVLRELAAARRAGLELPTRVIRGEEGRLRSEGGPLRV